ncbi:MAG TPA: hypothetical protein VH063_12760 [Gaiellaceae bacterium]|jgi:hypothetical protein|nr:hypothetical protein [Gaiellaceae bacterium]
MIDVEPLIREKLERLVPGPGVEGLDWSDVERRAGAAHPRRRVAFAAALVAAAVFVTVAVAQSLGGFSGWLTGEPGKPASTAEQQAFQRSIRSWAGFPKGTELRQLTQTTARGSTYTLDGFRGAGALCLRLLAGGGQPVDEIACPPLSQLRASTAPAIVVAADFGIGQGKKPATSMPFPILGFEPAVLVTLGIVADGVHRVEAEYSDGSTVPAVVNGDAFLAVKTNPASGVHLAHVWAIAGGRRIALPFVLQPQPFQWPSQTASAPQLTAHGPSRVQRQLHGGTIGWLAHRQPVGSAAPAGTKALYAREIAPNPSAPERMIVSEHRTARGAFGHLADRRDICASVVGGRYSDGGCWAIDRIFGGTPFSWALRNEGQYAIVAGLASDEVARLRLYLGTGATEPVSLHENGYLLVAPLVDYPLRLVAYDHKGLVIGVITLKRNQPPAGVKPPPAPVANAHWRVVASNNAGKAYVAPSTTGGTCYAVKTSHGGSISCPASLGATHMNLGMSWSPHGPTLADVHGGTRIASVVIRFKNGKSIHVALTEGIGIADVPPADVAQDAFRGARSLTGFDTHGRVVAIVNLLSLTGGAGRIAKLGASSIAIGVSNCGLNAASPSLTGFSVGTKVRYLCHGGILTLIGRVAPGSRFASRTTLLRGPITALDARSITIDDSVTGGARRCSLSAGSPATARYHVGEQVQAFCAKGRLTGINRSTG